MKIFVRLFLILAVSLGSECGVPLAYVDNSRMIVEGTLRFSNGDLATNQRVVLESENYVLNEAFSDGNGKFYITSPRTNKSIKLSFDSNDIGIVSYFGSLVVRTVGLQDYFLGLSQNYYQLGTIELKPIN